MSTSIEERIVKMSFNNSNFENGVRSTLTSLEKLKNSLDMSGAKTKFGELATAANGVRIDGLASQVENLTGKFEGMRVVALGALAAIGAKVVDLGIQFARDLGQNMTKSAREGFAEYETQINAIQSILANTEIKGENIDTVNSALDTLNKYSDQTIYNFTEMVSGIKSITTAGGDLNSSVATVKGFANVAALAGTNAQQMGSALQYGLTQAISKGKMMTQDWMSLETAGMASEAFKNSIVETARVNGIAVDEMIANAGSFRESLSEGWLTSDILQQTLEKFTGEMSDEQLRQLGYTEEQVASIQKLANTAVNSATKVKTITQLAGTIQEQIGSGWAQSWRTIIGDKNEAEELFTELSKRIGDMVQPSIDARNAQLELWDSMGGRTALVQSIWNVFDALHRVMDPVKKAFSEVFPSNWGATLAHISFAIRDFTAGLILSEKASENLGKVVKIALMPIKFVLDLIGGAFKVLWAVIQVGFQLLGSLIGLVTPLISFFIDLIPPVETASENTEDFADVLVRLIKGGVEPLIKWLGNLGTMFDDFLKGNDIAGRVDNIKSSLVGIGQAIAMVYNVLAKGDFTSNPFFAEDSKFVDILFKIREGAIAVGDAISGFFGNVKNAGSAAGGILSNVWGYLTQITQGAGPMFADLGSKIQEALSNIDIEQVLAAINTGVLLAVAVGIKKAFDQISGIFDGVSGIFDGVGDAIGGLTGVLEGMQSKLKADAMLKIAFAIAVLAGSLVVLAAVDPDRLIPAATGLATAAGILLGGLAILDKIQAEPSIKASIAIGLIAGAMNLMASAVAKMGGLSWNDLAKGLTGVTVAMGLMVGAAKILSKSEGEVVKAAGSMILMGVAINILAAAVAIFGNMDMSTLIQGGIAVAVTLGLLTGAAVILSKFAPQMVLSAVGLIAMAVALNMLVAPITALGLIPYEILTQGLTVLAVMLAGLVIAANMLTASGPGFLLAAVGMMAMAAAINMLVAPVAILGAMDLGTLIQGLIGLAAVMAILVVASNAMTGAIVGAGAMIVLAGAVLILSIALQMLGSMSPEQVATALITLAGAFIIIGAAALILAPLGVPILILAGAFVAFGIAMVAIAGATVLFAIGLAMLGPALLIATGGLLAFAEVAPKIAEAVPAFLGIGAGLLVFGAGAAVAGAGILILGAGLVVLGAGLALVGAVGIIGSTALTAFVLSLGKLAGEMPNMLAMAGTFTVLGAAVVVLGAGMLVLGAGGLLVGVALALLVPLGALITVSFNLITAAINKLLPQTEKVGTLSSNFNKLGSAIEKVGNSGRAASSGMTATATGFNLMGVAATLSATSVTMMGSVMVSVLSAVANTSRATAAGFSQSMVAMQQSINTFKMALASAAGPIESSARQIGRSVGPAIEGEIYRAAGSVRDAGYTVGRAITDGMANGVRSGQNNVTAAARSVAQSALAASKKTLGVASPSKEYFKIGAWQSEGQALGTLSNMGMVVRASEDLGTNAMKALQSTISGYDTESILGIDTNPVISPVLDLSEFQKSATDMGNMLGVPKLDVEGMRAIAESTRDEIDQTRNDKAESEASATPPIQFIQNNTSPKALSNSEIYRRTKNQLSVAKGALTTANAQPG